MSEGNIVVVGGGFAGVALAKKLERSLPPDRQVVLISPENSITYNPLLPEVVGASVLPGHVIAPIRQLLRRARFVMGEVTGTDLEARRVYYGREEPRTLDYEHLVLACGSVANLAIIPGMAAYALPLKTVGDALFIRNRILERLEQAEVEENEARRRWLSTFIVIGGGFGGVEAAGQIADFLRASLRYYPNVTPEACRVVVVHDGPRILPEVSERLSGFALTRMRRRGIGVELERAVARVDGRGVELASGARIEGGTVIATIGSAPTKLVEALPVAKRRGRIETAGDMSIPDRPGLWALGDCAAVPIARGGRTAPPTAQAATREAAWLAENLVCTLEGRPTRPFIFRARGQLAVIGDQKAVAEIFGVCFAGFFAWLLWRGFYLYRFPTFWRRVRIAFEWLLACFFPPDIAHLGFARTISAADPEREPRA